MKNNVISLFQNKPHQKNLRKGRLSLASHYYHITTATLNRMPIFNDFNYARRVIKHLKISDEIGATTTLAFVVMPDHLHWMFQLHHNKSLSNVMQSMKSMSAKSIGQPIWQAGYYDHALRGDEDMQEIARYIVANPLRAGFVSKVGDYPHWDAIWL